jgi:hypothetical protein
MKQLTWKLVLPLTPISFVLIRKEWHVEIEDLGNETLTGFPLPYVCPGWHTSLSLQIFVFELVINVLTHFAFWFFIISLLNKSFKSFKVSRIATIILLSIAGFFMFFLILLAINPDNIYTIKRPFDIKIKETYFLWE